MNKYLNEVSRIISGNGVTIIPDENVGLLKILYYNSPLCAIGTDGVRYHNARHAHKKAHP